MHRASTILWLLVVAQGCIASNQPSADRDLERKEATHPVMRYDVVELPPNVTVVEIRGEVFFAVENVGMVPVEANDRVKDGAVLVVGKEAYVLLNCNNQRCAEFNPAPKARWVVIETAE